MSDQQDYPPTAPPCEDCGQPGGGVTIRRAGVVIWRRVLCTTCFDIRRENTNVQAGLSLVPRSS